MISHMAWLLGACVIGVKSHGDHGHHGHHDHGRGHGEVTHASSWSEATHGGSGILDTAQAGSGMHYSWSRDGSVAGDAVMSGNRIHLEPRLQSFDITLVDSADGGSRTVFLDNSYLHVIPWTVTYAKALLLTLGNIPQDINDKLTPTRWILTSDFVSDDIRFMNKQVIISEHAFAYAKPLIPDRPPGKSAFFSKRLNMACVRFVVENMPESRTAIPEPRETRLHRRLAHIMSTRFGVQVRPSKIDYKRITLGPTGEDHESFQPFHADELISIVAMFEEMPTGLHQLPGLHTMLRRKTSRPHPTSPEAPAVAWPSSGYIEFMSSAFQESATVVAVEEGKSMAEYVFRLILHEKGHFVYDEPTFINESLKVKWRALGGWYKDPSGKWTTKDELSFVSAYAHLKNPNEDFAESLATYIRQPNLLRERAMGKYDFLLKHIARGVQYEHRYSDDLTFMVFNLWPDADPPGRVQKLNVDVDGNPEEDKTITLTIKLEKVTAGGTDSASKATLRLRHIEKTVPTYTDMSLYPVDEVSDFHVLRGQVTLSKYVPRGDWVTDQIAIRDTVGNERFVRTTDLGWQCVVNNPLEDREPPSYIPLSLTQSTTEAGVSNAQSVVLRWRVKEAHMLEDNCFATLLPPQQPSDEGIQAYGISEQGLWENENAPVSSGIFTCKVEFHIPAFLRTGMYEVGIVSMKDQALYHVTQTFHSTRKIDRQGRYMEPALTFFVHTAASDDMPPRINRNSIKVSARPYDPNTHDGETLVEISVDIRDVGSSGVGAISYAFINPLHHLTTGYIYHANFHGVKPYIGDPEAWTTYNASRVLPRGSQPGEWALHSILVHDRARNFKRYTFTEVVQSGPHRRLAELPRDNKTRANLGTMCSTEAGCASDLPTNDVVVDCHTCKFQVTS
eukprot:GEMP01003527.1.p1 GENE.GEMP01003527.1~~GEMP01003527.1.p1  ORF type:complete len:901 (+),score=151.82 GEMP01003527.1:76-2778(+)